MIKEKNMLDGVIKYHVSHSQGEAPHFAGYAGLEALRARLFALGLIGETSDGIGYGNISQRTGEHSFFITATQTGKQPALTPGKGDATTAVPLNFNLIVLTPTEG